MSVEKVICKERWEGDARCQELTRCLGGGRRGLDIPSLVRPSLRHNPVRPPRLHVQLIAAGPGRQPCQRSPTAARLGGTDGRQAEFALDEMVPPNKDPRGPTDQPGNWDVNARSSAPSSAMKHKCSTFRDLDRKRRLITSALGLATAHTPDQGRGLLS